MDRCLSWDLVGDWDWGQSEEPFELGPESWGQVGTGDNLARHPYLLAGKVLSVAWRFLCFLMKVCRGTSCRAGWEHVEAWHMCRQHWPDSHVQHWPRDEVVFMQQKAESHFLALRGALWEAKTLAGLHGAQGTCAPHAFCKIVRTALLWERTDVQKWGEREGEARQHNVSQIFLSRGMRDPMLLSLRVLSGSQ